MDRVESVYIYVRDSYSFFDEQENKSQYLGHWSTKAIFLAPMLSTYKHGVGSWISAPLVEIGRSIYDEGSIMYPVSNESFRQWRAQHRQGGDFIAYTKPRLVQLKETIVVEL